MSEITYYWKTIEDFLKKINIEGYHLLLGPADEKEINNLEKIVNIKLPDAFRESLLIHNGQEYDDIVTFLDGQRLLSVHEMIEYYNDLSCFSETENTGFKYLKPDECIYIKRQYEYNNKWLKFADTEGDGLILDFDPAEHGKSGQVFFRPHDDSEYPILADSYEEWLKTICLKLENNQYIISDNGSILFKDSIYNIELS